ncbi:MAG: Gfo/Idh/MocA family protein [Desulfitobacteriaceae bacterium]
MVRIGIISFAHMHAFSYAKALGALPGVKLVGIADDDQERGQDAAHLYGTNFYPNYEALLEDDIDGVIICSENARHAELTLAAAAHRKHVLCEKPIATNLDDAQSMISACEQAGVHLSVAFPCRFHPAAQRLKQVLDSGNLGDILAIKSTNHGKMPGGWFLDKGMAGGGAVMDHTVHVVDLIRWFFGMEITRIYAEADTLLHDVEVEDTGLLSLEIGNRIMATLDTSWSRPPAFPTWGDVTMEIVGTQGVTNLDLFAENIVVFGRGALTTHYESWGSDADANLIADFVRCLEAGKKPLVSGWDGLKALEVALAAYHSLAIQEPVILG